MNSNESPPTEPITNLNRRFLMDRSDLYFLIPFAALSALPVALLATFYTFAATVAVHIGHWPYYGHPDPKDLPENFNSFHVMEIIVPTIVFVVQTTLVVLLVARYVHRERRLLMAISIAAGIWLVAYALFLIDPVGVREWMAD